MKQRNIRMGLGFALVVTLIAAWFAPEPQDAEIVQASPRAAKISSSNDRKNHPSSPNSPSGHGTSAAAAKYQNRSRPLDGVLRIRDRSGPEDEGAHLFGIPSWGRLNTEASTPATDEPSVQALPASPVAPPIPLRLMGRYEEDGKSVVFLLQGDKSWVVREGDTLAENYKVEKIAVNAIDLLYLPSGEIRTLELGAP